MAESVERKMVLAQKKYAPAGIVAVASAGSTSSTLQPSIVQLSSGFAIGVKLWPWSVLRWRRGKVLQVTTIVPSCSVWIENSPPWMLVLRTPLQLAPPDVLRNMCAVQLGGITAGRWGGSPKRLMTRRSPFLACVIHGLSGAQDRPLYVRRK